LRERRALITGHDQEQLSVGGLFDRVKSSNVGVVERGRGQSFAHEALLNIFANGLRRRKKFNSDGSFKLQVDGAIHHAHPPFTQALRHLIVEENLPDQVAVLEIVQTRAQLSSRIAGCNRCALLLEHRKFIPTCRQYVLWLEAGVGEEVKQS